MREKPEEFYVESCYPYKLGAPKTRISDGHFEWIVDKEAEYVDRRKLIDLFHFYRDTYGT